MKTKALGLGAIVAFAMSTQGVTPLIAQPQAQESSEARAAKIRKYLNILQQQEAAAVKMPTLGTDRTIEIREKLIGELAEEVLSLREENFALKREVEELKKKR